MAFSYRPISLLSKCYKILERIILRRTSPAVDTGPSSSPCHLRRKWLSSTKKNPGVVFLDLTAAYDTVWHKGLLVKYPKFCHIGSSVSLNCSWDNGDFVSTWVTSAVHGRCRIMACHKDLYWHRLSSICPSMICQPQRAGNSFIPTTSAMPTKHTRLKISAPPPTLTLLRSANF